LDPHATPGEDLTMSDLKDDFLSVFGAALATVVGRAFLYMLACSLGIVAAHATATREFIWPWEAMWWLFPIALLGFVLSWWTFLLCCGLVGFLFLFLHRDMQLGFLLIPFVLVWIVTFAVYRLFSGG
jgi:hypothetical protein